MPSVVIVRKRMDTDLNGIRFALVEVQTKEMAQLALTADKSVLALKKTKTILDHTYDALEHDDSDDDAAILGYIRISPSKATVAVCVPDNISFNLPPGVPIPVALQQVTSLKIQEKLAEVRKLTERFAGRLQNAEVPGAESRRARSHERSGREAPMSSSPSRWTHDKYDGRKRRERPESRTRTRRSYSPDNARRKEARVDRRSKERDRSRERGRRRREDRSRERRDHHRERSERRSGRRGRDESARDEKDDRHSQRDRHLTRASRPKERRRESQNSSPSRSPVEPKVSPTPDEPRGRQSERKRHSRSPAERTRRSRSPEKKRRRSRSPVDRTT
eukprot:GHVO01033026.1.p1 GENE.GHVO01033026.1~~GHVO01033026.1.p1  ORF type:complete len:333 (-),score=23.89 GHVO01033026.1:110-1108(-)